MKHKVNACIKVNGVPSAPSTAAAAVEMTAQADNELASTRSQGITVLL